MAKKNKPKRVKEKVKEIEEEIPEEAVEQEEKPKEEPKEELKEEPVVTELEEPTIDEVLESDIPREKKLEVLNMKLEKLNEQIKEFDEAAYRQKGELIASITHLESEEEFASSEAEASQPSSKKTPQD